MQGVCAEHTAIHPRTPTCRGFQEVEEVAGIRFVERGAKSKAEHWLVITKKYAIRYGQPVEILGQVFWRPDANAFQFMSAEGALMQPEELRAIAEFLERRTRWRSEA